MFDRAQLRKGALEGCILQIIARAPAYGYAIAVLLRQSGFAGLTEGTLYPLLLRLERKGLIRAEYRASPSGPSRKYYALTEQGERELAEFMSSYEELARAVERLLADTRKEESP